MVAELHNAPPSLYILLQAAYDEIFTLGRNHWFGGKFDIRDIQNNVLAEQGLL